MFAKKKNPLIKQACDCFYVMEKTSSDFLLFRSCWSYLAQKLVFQFSSSWSNCPVLEVQPCIGFALVTH